MEQIRIHTLVNKNDPNAGETFDLDHPELVNGREPGVDTTQPPTRSLLPAAPKPSADLKDIPALLKFQKLKQEYDEVTGWINSQYSLAMKNYANRQAIYMDGFLAMVVLCKSVKTTSNFENAWL